MLRKLLLSPVRLLVIVLLILNSIRCAVAEWIGDVLEALSGYVEKRLNRFEARGEKLEGLLRKL